MTMKTDMMACLKLLCFALLVGKQQLQTHFFLFDLEILVSLSLSRSLALCAYQPYPYLVMYVMCFLSGMKVWKPKPQLGQPKPQPAMYLYVSSLLWKPQCMCMRAVLMLAKTLAQHVCHVFEASLSLSLSCIKCFHGLFMYGTPQALRGILMVMKGWDSLMNALT